MTRLFLDEDVPEAIAIALRLRGYNVVTTREAGRKSLTDKEQLDYAYSEERILLTHNIADFAKIHLDYVIKGKEHGGIILARQLPIGVIVKALLKLLSSSKIKNIQNQAIWLSDWIS